MLVLKIKCKYLNLREVDLDFIFFNTRFLKMAKANVILLNSILWNLREVTNLAEKIKKRYGDVDCTSWRYPLTSCSELEIFKLLQNNRNLDNYTYILELTYDRLLYLFNLMIKYLESADSMEKFRPNRNVRRPKTLSLASVLHMIWDRIQAQTESMNRTVVPGKMETDEPDKISSEKEINDSKSSTCTQSEICCISLCSCCEMVQQFVTQLVIEMEKVLEKQDFCSAISNERMIMRENLIEMTNWSVMSRWLTAIIKDFTTLSEKFEQVTVSSRKLKHRLESEDKKMKFKTEQHEEEVRRVELRLRDSETRMADLKHKLEKLGEENNQLKEEVRLKNSDLTTSSLNFEKKTAELKRNYEKKLKEMRDNKQREEKERQEEFKKSLETERKKLEKIESQNKQLEETVLNLKEDLTTLNVKTAKDRDTLMSALQELENKIESLKQENVSLNSVIEEKQNTIDDYSKRIMEAFPELNGTPTPKYRASGNPETDMENQMEANRLRMKQLESENEKLQRTLDKIKALKG